ncbi:hypothetical protein EME01_61830 [Sinorhizobium meliloti]|nr:hypothetical protein [Sinorhizobium meliloti]MDE4596006.1 hypothetical protein [Sinorhizobium meliloti]GEC42111.1 hypothetical protein EME01_61830 [Sinorhizobium meliloti]
MNQIIRQAFADAQAAFPFVIAQGRNIETSIYQRRYPTFNYGAHVPVVTEGNAWARRYRHALQPGHEGYGQP